jgi:16S rRNA (uracil1498-N3)-methyltransferase
MTVKAKIRLYVDAPMGKGQSLSLSKDQAHYITGVMRQKIGAKVALFNGRDGEWLSELVEAGKRRAVLICNEQTKPQQNPADIRLYFAPIKKVRTDFIVEKAAELGVAMICPVQTDFTNSERIRQDRLQVHAVEAAEQCGGTFVPPVQALQKLGAVLAQWPSDRKLLFCDETLVDEATQGLDGAKGEKWAILIGPEGGFSDAEIAHLRKMDETRSISLGPRVLRADTAAVAALTLWQNTLGDWR